MNTKTSFLSNVRIVLSPVWIYCSCACVGVAFMIHRFGQFSSPAAWPLCNIFSCSGFYSLTSGCQPTGGHGLILVRGSRSLAATFCSTHCIHTHTERRWRHATRPTAGCRLHTLPAFTVRQKLGTIQSRASYVYLHRRRSNLRVTAASYEDVVGVKAYTTSGRRAEGIIFRAQHMLNLPLQQRWRVYLVGDCHAPCLQHAIPYLALKVAWLDRSFR